LSYGLPEKISKHLFNDGISDFMSEKSNNSESNEFEVRKMIQDKIRDTFNLNIENFDFEYDEEEDEIQEIKNKQRSPSLDELLEKIKEKGLNSLTEKELSQLNKYSN
jgi:alkylation response protein AidB-like acyl-CoA dehydrogenase